MASITEGAILGVLLWQILPHWWGKLIAVFLAWFITLWDSNWDLLTKIAVPEYKPERAKKRKKVK